MNRNRFILFCSNHLIASCLEIVCLVVLTHLKQIDTKCSVRECEWLWVKLATMYFPQKKLLWTEILLLMASHSLILGSWWWLKHGASLLVKWHGDRDGMIGCFWVIQPLNLHYTTSSARTSSTPTPWPTTGGPAAPAPPCRTCPRMWPWQAPLS